MSNVFDVEIEATNLCNTRCVHCPHEAISRPMGKMSWETYQQVMDNILTYTNEKKYEVTVDFAGMGEPLLNPLIYRFIKHISDRTYTAITTNGSALVPRNIEQLIEAGLRLLIVSFNGSDRFTYELMMGGLSFQRAEQYLRTAIDLTRDTQTDIAINLSVTKLTQSKLIETINYLQQLGIDNISLSKCHNRGGKLNNPNVCDTPPPPSRINSRCDIFRQTLFVAWNGDVLSCCHDLEGENRIGNLMSNSLEEIVFTKQRVLEKGVNYRICAGCNDMYRFRDDSKNGLSLKEWIYHLYTCDNEGISYPDLLEWIYTIYIQENKPHSFIQRMWNLYDEILLTLHEKESNYKQLENYVKIIEGELETIRESETWLIAKKIQNIRMWLIPPGSFRERLIRKLHKEKKFSVERKAC